MDSQELHCYCVDSKFQPTPHKNRTDANDDTLGPGLLQMMEVRLSESSIWLLSALAFVGSAAFSTLHARYQIAEYKRQQRGGSTAGNEDLPAVPPHLKRMLYKEKRRKDSIRFLAMKKPMYDNIEMYSPEDELLCTISTKKAKWYIKKHLAYWKVPSKAIQLLFEPKSTSDPDAYNMSHKENACVVCGDSTNFMRHYVVPYCYRMLFPSKYKTHMPHDIVILCPDCHLHSEQATQKRQKDLEKALRKNPETARPHIPDKALHTIKSVALALKNKRSQLPAHKVDEFEEAIKSHFGVDSPESLSSDVLEKAMTMETSTPNPNYIPGPHIVVSNLANSDEAIEAFIHGWRDHFLTTMQPRFLPQGWSIESRIHI